MGVFIRIRTDGQLFNLVRLRAITKTRELCICKLLFADDAAIVEHTLEDTKQVCKHFEQTATLFGLTLSTNKTITLYQPPPGQTSIYGTLLNLSKTLHTWAARLLLKTPSMWKLTTVHVLPQEPLEDSGSQYGYNMVLQSPQNVRCTRRLYYQNYCTQLRRIFSSVATSNNFTKCISGIYDKSFGSHGKTTFQMRTC